MNLQKYHVSKNLFDLSAYYSVDSGVTNMTVTNNEMSYTTTETYRAIRYQFPFPYYSEYTIYFSEESQNTALEIRRYKDGDIVGNVVRVLAGVTQTLYNSEDYDEIRIYISNGTYVGDCKIINIMLNTGSTALPYEPYSADVWHDLAPQQYINGVFVDNTNIPEKYSGGSWG